MNVTYVIAGQFSREYVLPPIGAPLLDTPGGPILYSAAGLALWDKGIGLLGCVGEDYPRQWIRSFEELGFNTSGIKIFPHALDLRSFYAYNEKLELQRNDIVSNFARRQLRFPKALLGFQPQPEVIDNRKQHQPTAPRVTDIPDEYLAVSAVHINPMDFISQAQLISAFKQGTVTTISLDPSPGYMIPEVRRELPAILQNLTLFMPSREELQSLYWGETNDLWEMAEDLGIYGCELILIKKGAGGQLLYDARGKQHWEIPAYPGRIVDPTGVGDAFCGGFLAGYRKNYDPVEGALYGNVSASISLEGSGAFFPLDVLPGLAQARLDVLKELVRKV
ncbi:MAG: carbohydrate kinase family protein [Anaerolineales bacterium]|nr:carbohydrate kinase family protein [Anaerolineales bacterium]